MNNIEKLLSDIKELHGKCIITPRSEILLCSIEKDKNKEISMLHNVIWNYAKESEKLKEQFNNIINLIKTADTDEKINMLKELDTLEENKQLKDISKSHFNTMLECNEEADDLLKQVGELTEENTELKHLKNHYIEEIAVLETELKYTKEERDEALEEHKQLIYDFDSDEKNIHYKKLTEENTKLKLEVEKYDGTIKYIKELEGDNESLKKTINKIQGRFHNPQQCSYCICKVCGFDKSKSKGKNKYCSMCLDPAAQQDWLDEPMNFQ
jgi:chromosome segregation ATPase